jgi:hypothetical protein
VRAARAGERLALPGKPTQPVFLRHCGGVQKSSNGRGNTANLHGHWQQHPQLSWLAVVAPAYQIQPDCKRALKEPERLEVNAQGRFNPQGLVWHG